MSARHESIYHAVYRGPAGVLLVRCLYTALADPIPMVRAKKLCPKCGATVKRERRVG